MDHKEFEALLPDYILGMLSDELMAEMDLHARSEPDAASLLKEWQPIQQDFLAPMESPSEAQDERFMEFLHANTQESQNHYSWWQRWFPRKPHGVLLLGSAACIILLIGFVFGSNFNNTTEQKANGKIASEALEDATQETDAVRTQLVMSLADQPSAAKRLEALSEVSKLKAATDKVISALFKMLNEDTNVNVRLAAVTSLSKYVDNPKVREGLVLSIIQQESPLVQIALAELMVTLKEQKSINSMESLLQRPETNEAVKQKLEESIKQII